MFLVSLEISCGVTNIIGIYKLLLDIFVVSNHGACTKRTDQFISQSNHRRRQHEVEPVAVES